MSEPLAVDYDAIVAEFGGPIDWREQGWDAPDYMVSTGSVYRQDNGTLKCVWPGCGFKRRDVEAMFRHVHDPRLHPAHRQRIAEKRASIGEDTNG